MRSWGTNELEHIVAHCESAYEEPLPAAEPYLYHDLTPRRLATAPYMAYMKVNEGCDHPCTFCIIPKFRGRFRSRRFESVIREATELFQRGFVRLAWSAKTRPATAKIWA